MRSNFNNSKKVRVYDPSKPRAGKGKKPGIVKSKEFVSDESISSEMSIMIRSKLTSVFASLSPVKMLLTQYFASNDEWPKKLSDIGMKKDEMTSSYIDAVTLDGSGGVVARLNSDFGKNKRIVIQPKSFMGGTSFEWKCYANFTKQLLSSSIWSMCESRVIK